MRWVLLLAAVLGGGACAGGQTGEITGETSCTEPTEIPLAESDRARLEGLGEPWTGPLAWEEDGTTTELTLSFAVVGETATELGGAGCERTVLSVPVELRLDTADGRLADAMLGRLEQPRGIDQGSIRASLPLVEVEGTFDPTWLGPVEDDARLVASLTRGEGTSSGQIFVAPGGGGDELHVAAW